MLYVIRKKKIEMRMYQWIRLVPLWILVDTCADMTDAIMTDSSAVTAPNVFACGQHGHFTRQGAKQHNEDASHSFTLFGEAPAPSSVVVLIVADGHGRHGEGKLCADFCVSAASSWVQSLLHQDWNTINWAQKGSELTNYMHNEFRNVLVQKNDRIIAENGIVCDKMGDFLAHVHSGSTFSMTLTFPLGDIIRTVAIQVGDSDIYINGERVECDHSPLNPEEWRRIQTILPPFRPRCVFDANSTLDVFLPDGTYNPKHYDATGWKWNSGIRPNCAKYTPGTYLRTFGLIQNMQLACTRSIGDYYGHITGLTCEPMVFIKDTVECPHITVGSDGAFDTIDSKDKWVFQAGDTYHVHIDLGEKEAMMDAVAARVNLLYTLYAEKFGAKHVDDVSVACLHPRAF